jgi:hypothetical protein
MAENWHWARDMPGLARLVPELRRTTFYKRVFFSFWTAQFDLAAVGLFLGCVTKRRLWLLSVLPYGRRLARESRHWGLRSAPRYVAGSVAVEAVRLIASIVGSVGWRSPVL